MLGFRHDLVPHAQTKAAGILGTDSKERGSPGNPRIRSERDRGDVDTRNILIARPTLIHSHSEMRGRVEENKAALLARIQEVPGLNLSSGTRKHDSYFFVILLRLSWQNFATIIQTTLRPLSFTPF
jgi:hypothetical protein